MSSSTAASRFLAGALLAASAALAGEKASDWLAKAREAYQAGRWSEAMAAYQQLLWESPDETQRLEAAERMKEIDRRMRNPEEAPPPKAAPGTTWTVKKGDTLSGIARSVYGDPGLWKRIAEANPGVNPSRLRIGTVLAIPEIPAEEPPPAAVPPPPTAPVPAPVPEPVRLPPPSDPAPPYVPVPAPAPPFPPRTAEVRDWDVGSCLEAFRAAVEPDCTDAREALRRRGPSVLPALLEADRRDPPASVRLHIAWVLGVLGDPSAAGPLQGRLADASPEVRLEACRALGRLKATPAAPKLRDLLKDGTTRVRGEAALALGRLGDAESVEPLSAILTDWRKEQPGEVRASAAEALGRIGAPTCRGPLVGALKDGEARVRRAAIGGLSAMTNGVDRCYDPDAPEAERAAALKSWGEWLAEAK